MDRLSPPPQALTVSLRQAAVWWAERYGVAGVPERNENLKGLLRDQLRRWHEDGAQWIRSTGSGPSTRFHVELAELALAAEQLPHCLADGCCRPALRSDGACGTCGYGRTGRPRETEWALRDCAGCGARAFAPLYGRQRRWWCDDCNGRDKHPPEQRQCEVCSTDLGVVPGHVLAAGGGRFCGHSCSAHSKWMTGVLNEQTVAPGRNALARLLARRQKAHLEIKAQPGVLTIPAAAERLFVSTSRLYTWAGRGWLPFVDHGHFYTTDDVGLTQLLRILAKVNSRYLLDPQYANAKARVVHARRALILPHRAGAKPKDALKAEWRQLFYAFRQTLSGRSNLDICRTVADHHFRTCSDPTVWRKYEPNDDDGIRAEDEANAARRIWMAIR